MTRFTDTTSPSSWVLLAKSAPVGLKCSFGHTGTAGRINIPCETFLSGTGVVNENGDARDKCVSVINWNKLGWFHCWAGVCPAQILPGLGFRKLYWKRWRDCYHVCCACVRMLTAGHSRARLYYWRAWKTEERNRPPEGKKKCRFLSVRLKDMKKGIS